MNCRDIQQHLLANGELTSAELAHVSGCAECRRLELGLNQNRALLAPIASVAPARSLAAAAMARREVVVPRRSRAWGWFALAPAVAAGAVAMWPRPHVRQTAAVPVLTKSAVA